MRKGHDILIVIGLHLHLCDALHLGVVIIVPIG